VYLPDLHPAEWDAIRAELREVAVAADLVVFRLLADFLDVRAASARLDLAAWRAGFERFRAIAQEYELRPAQIVAHWLEGHYAHLTGDLDGAERAYRAAYDEQRRVNGVDADGQYGLAIATVRLSQDRFAEMTDVLARITAELPPAADGYALALAEAGRPDEAAAVLQPPAHLYVDVAWLLWTALRGLAVAAVGDTERAAELYETLLPFADRVAGAGTSGYVLTPVARVLGRLAVRLDRPDDAAAHFARAAEVARHCGSAAWLAQVERDAAAVAPAR
jgi:tetratricopeptide (TPR) repeat protein